MKPANGDWHSAVRHARQLVAAPADLGALDRPLGDSRWILACPAPRIREGLSAFSLFLDRCDAGASLTVFVEEDREASELSHVLASLGMDDCAGIVALNDRTAAKTALVMADVLVAICPGVSMCAIAAAFAAGVPTVAFGDAGFTMTRTPLAWDAFDPALVCASVERVRDDPDLRRRLRARGFAEIDRAGIDRAQENRS